MYSPEPEPPRTMTKSRRNDRLARLALAVVVAFAMVAGLTAVASAVVPATAHAAQALTVCPELDQVPVTTQDGASRCVENTCEAIMGAEGRASECTSERAPLDISVPAAGETGAGVAPVAARVADPSPAPADSSDRSTLATLAWIFGGIGIVALLVAAALIATGRVRVGRGRGAATRTSA